MELLWATRLASPPAALAVGAFASVQGLIVSLSVAGELLLSYLGTDPPSSAVTNDAKDLDYEAMDEEHRRLLQTIRSASSEGQREPTECVSLRAQVPQVCDSAGHGDDGVTSLTVRVFASYNGGATLESVALCASCTPPLFLTTDTVTLPSLAGGNRTPTIVPFTFRAKGAELPVDLSATIVATYITAAGESRCARCDVMLPLCVVAVPTPLVKHTDFKVTLDVNRLPPPLASLFDDVLQSHPEVARTLEGNATALSLQFHCGLDATVLISKSAGRYRIQSSAFEGLWLLCDEIERRLRAYYTARREEAEEPFRMSYVDPLPLQECDARRPNPRGPPPSHATLLRSSAPPCAAGTLT
jgi:Bardet-Biedl syndrome 9 protein